MESPGAALLSPDLSSLLVKAKSGKELTLDQLQALQHIQQLRTWKQRQQDDLLVKQELTLDEIYAKQEKTLRHFASSRFDSDSIKNPRSFDGAKPVSSHNSSFGRSPLKEVNSVVTENEGSGKRFERAELDSSLEVFDNQSETELVTSTGGEQYSGKPDDERPIRPGIGPNSERAATFEEFLEEQLRLNQGTLVASQPQEVLQTPKKPFLQKGQGLERYKIGSGIKVPKHAVANNSPSKVGLAQESLPGSTLRGSWTSSLRGSSNELQIGSSEDLLRKEERVKEELHPVKRTTNQSGMSEVEATHYPSSEMSLLKRFPSDDSFVVRRKATHAKEKQEMEEFLLLEQMTQNSLFSSQSLEKYSINQQNKPPLRRRKLAKITEFNKADHDGDLSETCSEVTTLGESSAPEVDGSDSESEGDQTLIANEDPTKDHPLKPSEQLQFNDDEEWDSFNNSVPTKRPGFNFGSGDDSSTACEEGAHQVLREKGHLEAIGPGSRADSLESLRTDSVGIPLCSSTPPAKALSELGRAQEVSKPFNMTQLPHACGNEEAASRTDGQPQPPSALMARLFPGLRKQKELSKHPLEATASPTRAIKVAGEVLNPEVSALQNELRNKLNELEKEIKRYRTENAAIEKLRKEREHVLKELQIEREKFERYKKTEMDSLTAHRDEEMRKLKKERKLFETYRQETLGKPGKKERQEIEDLKQEVAELSEAMEQKDARWSATVTRYKQKIETLEAQNKEIQNDLRIMEQERLEQWQLLMQHQKKSKSPALAERQKSSPVKEAKKMQDKATISSVGSKTVHRHTSERSTKGVSGQKKSRGKSILSSKQKPAVSGDRKQGRRITKKSKHPVNTLLSSVPNPSRSTHSTASMEINTNDSNALDCIEEGDNDSDFEGDVSLSQVIEEVVIEGPQLDESKECARPHLDAANEDLWMKEHEDLAKRAEEVVNKMLGLPTHGSGSEKATLSKDDLADFSSESKEKKVTFREDRGIDAYCKSKKLISPSKTENRVEMTNPDGSQAVIFPNGTKKIIGSDGKTVTINFFNGDVKQVKSDQTVIYHYSETNTTQTSYPNGLEVFCFANNQVEKHYPDGKKEITFPDKSTKYIYPNGEEMSVFKDGSIQKRASDGTTSIEYPNGQREIHTAEYKRREYPDGTTKTVYKDGRQETCYSSGKVRIKDSSGKVLVEKYRSEPEST